MKIPIRAAQNKQRGRQFDMPAIEFVITEFDCISFGS